jgi:hypothetical protein
MARFKTESAEHWRRSIYIYVKRQLLMPSMELFDAPTTTDSCAMRTQSTVPTQALVLMNDEFIEEQAGYLARRAKAEAGDALPQIVERLFLLTLSRKPTEQRLQQALEFLDTRASQRQRNRPQRPRARPAQQQRVCVYRVRSGQICHLFESCGWLDVGRMCSAHQTSLTRGIAFAELSAWFGSVGVCGGRRSRIVWRR